MSRAFLIHEPPGDRIDDLVTTNEVPVPEVLLFPDDLMWFSL